MFDKLSKTQFYLVTSIIAIFCNILWGTAFPVLKIVYADLHIVSSDLGGTITFISLRFLLAGIIILIFGLITKVPLFKVNKKQILLIIILGLFNTTLQYFFFNIGVNNTPGIKASILGQFGIFFSVILAHFVYKDDRLNIRKILGLTLGFIGLILVNLNKGSSNLLHFTLLGEGFMILSGIASSLAMFIAKRIGKEVPTIVYTSWQMIVGSLMLLCVGYLMGGDVTTLHFTPRSFILFIYLALLSSVAFCLWYYILQYRKIGEISLYKFFVPVSGTLLTALFVPGETLLPIYIVALLLVSVGIIIVNRKPPKK